MKTNPFPSVPGGFKTIICDPPWRYAQTLGRGKKEGDLARGGLPYESMSLEEICALRVGEIAADDSMLFLWTTSSHLRSSFTVIDAWGFQEKATGTWVKQGETGKVQIGLGYWLRGAAEYFILGVKGNPRAKLRGPNGATGLAVSNVILAPRQEHSRKPQEIFEKAEAMGEGPYLELFARGRARKGWTVWGNEAAMSGKEPVDLDTFGSE